MPRFKYNDNMFTKLATILCTIYMLTQQYRCLNLLDLSKVDTKNPKAKVERTLKTPGKVEFESYKPVKVQEKPIRRYWVLTDDMDAEHVIRKRVYEDETDTNIKEKISMLVRQTMFDAEGQMTEVNKIKQRYREDASYKAGFILAMIKKSKNILDELFNVAVKHRNEWLALEHLKIFEMIVHTNVDTSNYLRQLVDIHIKQVNSTKNEKKKRIILL